MHHSRQKLKAPAPGNEALGSEEPELRRNLTTLLGAPPGRWNGSAACAASCVAGGLEGGRRRCDVALHRELQGVCAHHHGGSQHPQQDSGGLVRRRGRPGSVAGRGRGRVTAGSSRGGPAAQATRARRVCLARCGELPYGAGRAPSLLPCTCVPLDALLLGTEGRPGVGSSPTGLGAPPSCSPAPCLCPGRPVHVLTCAPTCPAPLQTLVAAPHLECPGPSLSGF